MFGNKRLLIIGSVLLALGTAMAVRSMVLEPHQRHMALARTQLQQEQELLQLQSELAQLMPTMERYAARLPGAPSPEWLMGEVSRLAERAHVRLVAIEPEAARPVQGGATRLAVMVRLEGRFHDVGRLVSQMESSTKYMHVDELDIKPLMEGGFPRVASDGASQLGEARLVVSTVYLPALTQRVARQGATPWAN